MTEIYISVSRGELNRCLYDGVISAEEKKRLDFLGHIFNHRRLLPTMIPVDSNNT